MLFHGMPFHKFLIFMFNPQNASSQMSTNNSQLCLKNSPKNVCLNNFLLGNNINYSFICYICQEKGMYVWICGSMKSANHKRLGPQI
jgi:hypothetical protein